MGVSAEARQQKQPLLNSALVVLVVALVVVLVVAAVALLPRLDATDERIAQALPFVIHDRRDGCEAASYLVDDDDLFEVAVAEDDGERDDESAPQDGLVLREVNLGSEFGDALGFDAATNQFYAIRHGRLVDVFDIEGEVVSTKELTPSWTHGEVHAATVLADGTYIVATYGSGDQVSRHNMWSVEPTSGEMSWIGAMATAHADFSVNPRDGYLYHVTGGDLFRIDPRDASETILALPPGLAGHGASWFDGAGNLYLHHNSTGRLFRVSGADGSGPLTWLDAGEGRSVGASDGASCIAGLSLMQEVSPIGTRLARGVPEIIPGASFQMQYRVYYNPAAYNPAAYNPAVYNPADETTAATQSGGASLPVVVCDEFGPGGPVLSGAIVDSTGEGLLVTGGTEGASAFCIQVDAAATQQHTPGGASTSPVTITVDLTLPSTFAVDPSHDTHIEGHGWIELDGDPKSHEIMSDSAGTGVPGDATVLNVAALAPEGVVYVFADSGLGTGASEVVASRTTTKARRGDVLSVQDPMVVLRTDFLAAGGYEPLSGRWQWVSGELRQRNNSGQLAVAILTAPPVDHYRFETVVEPVTADRRVGLAFNMRTRDGIDGAWVVLLDQSGSEVTWGKVVAGQLEVTASSPVEGAGEGPVQIGVEVHGTETVILVNGIEVGSVTTDSEFGWVGLASAPTEAGFISASLVALPAAGLDSWTSPEERRLSRLEPQVGREEE